MISLGLDIGGTSVKYALVRDGVVAAQGRSAEVYRSPDVDAVRAVLAAVLGRLTERPDVLGVCVPGVFSPTSRSITASVNHPGLVGLELDRLMAGVRADLPWARVVPDAYAAAVDLHHERRPAGRLLALSLGTGVGACVLDDGAPLKVSPPDAGLSSGHLGQMDISMISEGPPPVDAGGGLGSVEAYLGARAIKARLGLAEDSPIPSLEADDPAVLALVRTLRIAHAIYRPDTVAILGGVGLALGPLGREIHARVSDRLTVVARPAWELVFATDAYYAARGAARLAEGLGASPTATGGS